MSKSSFLNKIFKFIYRNLPLIIILAAGIIIRVLFYQSISGPIKTSDSETYIGGAKNMLRYLCFDEYRPPVYLFQLLFLGVLFSWENLEFVAVIAQSIVGLLNAVILYKLAMEAFDNKLAAFISALFTVISVTIYSWDFTILTENLSIFLITLITYFMILYMRNFNRRYLKAVLITSAVSIFTKPFFLVLPILIALILLINYIVCNGFKLKLGPHFKTAISGFLCIYLSVLLYSGANQLQHSFFGITTVGKVNTFGKILQYGMEDYGTNHEVVDDVKEAFAGSEPQYIVNGTFLEPWHFIGTYGWNKNHYSEIGSFAKEIILKNPIEYIQKSFKLTGSLLLKSPFEDFIAEAAVIQADHPDKLMLTVKKISDAFDRVYFVVIICIFELILVLILRRDLFFRKNYLYLLSIMLLVLYHYIISAFFSYGDYCRLLAPCFPLIYLVIAFYISRIINFGAMFTLKILNHSTK